MRLLTKLVPVAAMLLSACAANVVKTGGNDTASVKVPAASASKLVLNMSGPPAVTSSSDWILFQAEWQSAFTQAAQSKGINFSMQQGDSKPTAQAGTLLSVYVNDYHYLSPGARYGLGVMTGNAYINARLRFIDLATGSSFGVEDVNTSSTAWQGIFSAMTEKQVQAIAADVMQDMKK